MEIGQIGTSLHNMADVIVQHSDAGINITSDSLTLLNLT